MQLPPPETVSSQRLLWMKYTP